MYQGRLTEIPKEVIEHMSRGRAGNILAFLEMANAGQMDEHLTEIFAIAEKIADENVERLSKLLGFSMASDEDLEKSSIATGLAFAMATIITGLSSDNMNPAAELRLYADAIRSYVRMCKQAEIPYEEALETLVFQLKNLAATIEDAIQYGYSEGRIVLAVDQSRADDLNEVGISKIIKALEGHQQLAQENIKMAAGYVAPTIDRSFTPTIFVSAN